MKLFIDDLRKIPDGGYQCCRDAESAFLLLSHMKFEHISIDYCLGENSKNGLDILKWMKENNVYAESINIHSDHEVGKELMREFCEKNFPDTTVTMNTNKTGEL